MCVYGWFSWPLVQMCLWLVYFSTWTGIGLRMFMTGFFIAHKLTNSLKCFTSVSVQEILHIFVNFKEDDLIYPTVLCWNDIIVKQTGTIVKD